MNMPEAGEKYRLVTTINQTGNDNLPKGFKRGSRRGSSSNPGELTAVGSGFFDDGGRSSGDRTARGEFDPRDELNNFLEAWMLKSFTGNAASAAKLRTQFETSLNRLDFRPEVRDLLLTVYDGCQGGAAAPSAYIPVSVLGIDTSTGKFGYFNPSATKDELKEIELKFVEEVNAMVKGRKPKPAGFQIHKAKQLIEAAKKPVSTSALTVEDKPKLNTIETFWQGIEKGKKGTHETQREALEKDLQHIKSRYGIDVSVDKSYIPAIYLKDAKELSLFEATIAVRVLREELSKYPLKFIKQSGLRLIGVLKEKVKTEKSLWHDMQEAGGIAGRDSGLGYIVLGNSYLPPLWGSYLKDDWFRCVFHHEFFHVASGGARFEHLDFGEKEWMDLEESRDEKDHTSLYGMTNYKEDQAEVVAKLMTDPKFLRETNRSMLLERKKAIIKSEFYKMSEGLMDADYFRDLADGKVKEGYWEAKEE